MDLVIIVLCGGAWEFFCDPNGINGVIDPLNSPFVSKSRLRTVTAESAREDYGVKIPGFINKRV